MIKFVLLPIAILISALAIPVFNRVAVSREILARINSRTLHERAVPRGAGIVFGAVFSGAMLALWILHGVSTPILLAIGLGGLAAATVGFVDDAHGVRASAKATLQVLLSVWMLAMLWSPLYAPAFQSAGLALRVVGVAFVLFVPVWMINVFNFIDGIDGQAVSAGLFAGLAAIIVLALGGSGPDIGFVAALLVASCVAFLFWNLPPARVFMGDAGSIFLGYCISALMLTTVVSGTISAWTWIAILAYYIADTSTTTICRIFMVRQWYGAHRSHAYQNLARINQSHARVTYGVIAYQLFWCLPLVVWSALRPNWAPLAAALSLTPAVWWAFKFGPRLSSN